MIKRIKIDNTDIFLEDLGNSKGKITISDTYDNNYSYFWGSMGGTLESFLCSINKEYFAGKLLGSKRETVIDVKRTFAEVRKYIREEIGLPWYDEQEFQKDMREKLNDFQNECEEYPGHQFFVDGFYDFISRLSYYLLDSSKWDNDRIEKDFKGISEPWYFIHDKPSREYLWLEKLHGKLVKKLRREQKVQECDS